jgi:hypothetical protein
MIDMTGSAIFCNPAALTGSQRAQSGASNRRLMNAVQERRELENGFMFRFPNRPRLLLDLGRFIGRESVCCPFLDFKLEVRPGGGPVWLQLTGVAGTKQFLEAEFGLFLEAGSK